MNSIVVRKFGGPEVLGIETLPDPKPARGQLLVRVSAAGVNPVDTYILTGGYAFKPALPYTPGCEAAGTVESVGDGVTRFKSGDRVYTSGSVAGLFLGSYAELVLCEEAQVHPLPDKLTFSQGAAVAVAYATAYRALFQRARAKEGETALVHGASGGVGTAAVQLALGRKLRVIGTAGSERGMKLVGDQGAHHVLDHSKPGYLDELNKLTDGRGVNVIIEMLANVNLAKDLEAVAKFGRVVVVGCRGSIEINPRLMMGKDSTIHGMALVNPTTIEFLEIFEAIDAGLADGTLRPVVGKEIPLEDAADALEEVMRPGAYGKVVLVT